MDLYNTFRSEDTEALEPDHAIARTTTQLKM